MAAAQGRSADGGRCLDTPAWRRAAADLKGYAHSAAALKYAEGVCRQGAGDRRGSAQTKS